MMTPEAVIEAYVGDVARRLPRARRNDVALELRALLFEELQGKAEAQGRAADEAMALSLVRGFGAPDDVAERYRAPGFVIVPAARTAGFVQLAIAGVLLQWLLSLPAALLRTPGQELQALGSWWVSHGIGALWWPGFMVMAAIIAGWVRHQWPPAQPAAWRPHPADRDDINRMTWAALFVAAAAGASILAASPWLARELLPPAAQHIFNFDPDFLSTGAAIVVAMWSAHAVLAALVIFEGRWRPLTRKLDLVLAAAWILVMGWLAFGPRIFLNPPTEEAAKGWMGVILLLVLADLALKLRRWLMSPRGTPELSGARQPNARQN